MEGQLKFVASLFKMTIKELDNVMGPESIQAIFRLMGENQGEAVEARMKKKYEIDNWTPEQFADSLIKDVLEPALGEDSVEYKLNDNELIFNVKVCPFRRGGINITNKLYCNYTEGLIETAAKKALQNIEFNSEDSQAKGGPSCIFKIKINQ